MKFLRLSDWLALALRLGLDIPGIEFITEFGDLNADLAMCEYYQEWIQ